MDSLPGRDKPRHHECRHCCQHQLGLARCRLANILPNCLDTNASNPLATFGPDATHPTAAGQFKWRQAWDAALRQPARHQEDVTVPQTGYGFDWIDPSGALALHASAAQTAIPGSLAVGGPITVALYQTPWVPDDTYPLLSWYQVSASLYATNGGLVTLANLSAGPAATNSQPPTTGAAHPGRPASRPPPMAMTPLR